MKPNRKRCGHCNGWGLAFEAICPTCQGWGVLPIPKQPGKGSRKTTPAAVAHFSPIRKVNDAGVLPVGGRQGVERWRHAPRERVARPVESTYLPPEQLAKRRKDAGLDP